MPEDAWLKDQAQRTRLSRDVQVVGTQACFRHRRTCLLLHGHSAYTAELPYEQRLRDVLGLQIGDGTAQIMKLIIARHKVGPQSATT